MKLLLLAVSALALLALLPARTSAAAPAVELDDGNFDEQVLKRRKEMWLVMFYAPWCGHCKHLKPIFDEAASKARTYGMRMGKMDATASEVVAARYEVKGYPTLLYYRDNEPHKYKAGRSAEPQREAAVAAAREGLRRERRLRGEHGLPGRHRAHAPQVALRRQPQHRRVQRLLAPKLVAARG